MDEAQLERDRNARRSLSRAAGIALIEMSAALEEGLGVGHGAGPATFAAVAFGMRARRLLRSAYRLIDVDEADAAVPLYRIMNEHLIVGRWLIEKASEDDLKVWALSDLRDRLKLLRDVISDPRLDDTTKATLAEEVTRTEESIRGHGGDDEPTTKRSATKAGQVVPSLETMAREAGLSFVYAYPYRLMSQTDVHATAAAVDSAFEADDDGRGHRVRRIPRYALEGYDGYIVGAHLLLDILRPLAERIPELGWERTTTMIADTLQTITRADPDSGPPTA